MTEVIYLGDRRYRAAPAEVSSLPPLQGTETDPGVRRAALYDMLRILGRTVRTGEMGVEEKTEFALAALKVLGPGWALSRSC
jgi:hypothetical protein